MGAGSLVLRRSSSWRSAPGCEPATRVAPGRPGSPSSSRSAYVGGGFALARDLRRHRVVRSSRCRRPPRGRSPRRVLLRAFHPSVLTQVGLLAALTSLAGAHPRLGRVASSCRPLTFTDDGVAIQAAARIPPAGGRDGRLVARRRRRDRPHRAPRIAGRRAGRRGRRAAGVAQPVLGRAGRRPRPRLGTHPLRLRRHVASSGARSRRGSATSPCSPLGGPRRAGVPARHDRLRLPGGARADPRPERRQRQLPVERHRGRPARRGRSSSSGSGWRPIASAGGSALPGRAAQAPPTGPRPRPPDPLLRPRRPPAQPNPSTRPRRLHAPQTDKPQGSRAPRRGRVPPRFVPRAGPPGG